METDTLRTFVVTTDGGGDLDDFCVLLSSPEGETSYFHLEFGHGGPFATTSGVVAAISAMPAEFPDEPVHRKTWRFTRDHSYRYTPLTGLRWQHHPALFFNSLGFGICDDVASVNHHLWDRLGYRTRVWGLEGHVVGEVEIGGSWEMYDSSYDVYYHNADHDVASVQDLELRPDLVLDPLDPVSPLAGICYSADVAGIYESSHDNEVKDWYTIPEQPYELSFLLPPGGRFAFPLPPKSELPLRYDAPTPPLLANAELMVPAGWSGTVDIALVIHTIEGAPTDSVVLDGTEFFLGSGDLQDFINDRTRDRGRFFSALEFDEPAEPVRVRYLVNPAIFTLDQGTTMRLSGRGLGGITCDVLRHEDLDLIP